MEIILVRHGQTEGNKVHRFIGGGTDEPVSREGMEALQKRTYPQPEHIFSSPMLRCVQTAQTIFRGRTPEMVEGFRECDFGILEGKTHGELLGDPAYDAFIGRSGRASPAVTPDAWRRCGRQWRRVERGAMAPSPAASTGASSWRSSPRS